MKRSIIAAQLLSLSLASGTVAMAAEKAAFSRQSALSGESPDTSILHHDIDDDGVPDVLERWWHGKRVRWLDENHDLQMEDTMGDLTGDMLQVDLDGDGFYDGPSDLNVKWIDSDKDGVADVQTIAANRGRRGGDWHGHVGSHWMIFINHDNRGALGWMDWAQWDFDCWGYSGVGNWLPNYHNGDFLKAHTTPGIIEDPRLNWENPFSFFDLDGDGLVEMAHRWLMPRVREPGESNWRLRPGQKFVIADRADEAFLTFDLDNDSGKGNETDFDMSLRGAGGPGVAYTHWSHKIPELRGETRFDAGFQWNNWRHIDELLYVPRDKSYDTFFGAEWGSVFMTFDEDDDDRRWERVELMYPVDQTDESPADPWSTQRWRRNRPDSADPDAPTGICGNRQADTLGDRGEFDLDGSGEGRLYVGRFDRKLHLYGAEWGAWTVDRKAEFHGGWGTPSPLPVATEVEEVVRYSDTDANGFLDRIEFDYDGDRTIDFIVDLLSWKTAEDPHPDVAEILETSKLGWEGLHEQFKVMAEDSWQEALMLYRVAWRRGMSDTEIDLLAVSSSHGERYDHAYWLKETLLRRARARLADLRQQSPAQAEEFTHIERDLIRTFYLGDFSACADVMAQIPGR